MSGQVRSECLTCTYRARCCSARLSRAQVPAPLSGKGENRGGGSKGGGACTGGYKGVRAVRPESVAGEGWFEVLWNLECPVGLSQKKNMCAFQMKEIWRHFDGPSKDVKSLPTNRRATASSSRITGASRS